MTDRQSLVLSHAWVVDRAVGRWGRRREAQEACQEGYLALVGAAAEWDGRDDFARFAAPRVRGAIRGFLKRHRRVWEAEWAAEDLDELEAEPAGFDVETESMVRRAMGEALDEEERAAIRRRWLAGDGPVGRGDRKVRRRAEAKLRKHLAG